MPIVTIDFVEGRTIEQKREMVNRVTNAISETLNCPKEAITIIMHELTKDQIAQNGKLRCD